MSFGQPTKTEANFSKRKNLRKPMATKIDYYCICTKLPKPHIKGLLRKSMLEEWQTSRRNGDIGRKIYNIMPSVSLRPTNWIREDVIFFSQHGPFPAYHKRFHLSDSDYCSCGGIGKARHFTLPRSVFSQCLGI
ncbi:hypothetical protein AVEN_132373-1 [Araneus ventricosus]|uniref:Uncharacterized protein n=1 Tax=Araneus ventricosus TaxID=182803 RepID=A0A4Y2STS3_ARAVE|nr:hypothetical protein AVEN_132373-1 [Araneus ventricosus]